MSAERQLRHRARRQRMDRARKLRAALAEEAYVRLTWPSGVTEAYVRERWPSGVTVPAVLREHIAGDRNVRRIAWRIGHHAGRLFAMREEADRG